jgi:hypothetical protein
MLSFENQRYAMSTLTSRHGSRSEHVADDEHPDPEYRIDGGPTDLGVIGSAESQAQMVFRSLVEPKGSSMPQKRAQSSRSHDEVFIA